jgi:N-acetylmuramoyl-L-alanine amidase
MLGQPLVIRQGKLVGVPFEESASYGGALPTPTAIIIHFTGGATAQSSAEWFQNPAAKASAHVIVDRDGSIIQCVPFTRVAFHAGRSSWKGRVGANNFTIGIEIANWGILSSRADGMYYSSSGAAVHPNRVVLAEHKNENVRRAWEAYTPEQVRAVGDLITALKASYPTLVEVIGHEDVAPSRKTDPGPAAPMRVWQSKLNSNRDSDEADYWQVDAPGGVNLRTGPATTFKVLRVLPDKLKVVCLDRKNSWFKVELNSNESGWVHSNYLKDI